MQVQFDPLAIIQEPSQHGIWTPNGGGATRQLAAAFKHNSVQKVQIIPRINDSELNSGVFDVVVAELTRTLGFHFDVQLTGLPSHEAYIITRGDSVAPVGDFKTQDVKVVDSRFPDRDISETPKKVPRPMNCWMLFRDHTHRHLKEQNSTLSVQEISQECSKMWKDLDESTKDEWREKAIKAKEKHARMYPGYKYAPRKPGEKKKRQSRKSILSARADAATPAPAQVDFFKTPMAATDNDAVTLGDNVAIPAVVLEALNPIPMTDDYEYFAEAVRQQQLETEVFYPFGGNGDPFNSVFYNSADTYDTIMPSMTSDNVFRDGANADAVLPALHDMGLNPY